MNENNTLTLHIKYGNKRLSYDFKQDATLHDLLNTVEQSTGVPASCQRLIHNGKTLNGPNSVSTEILGHGGLGLNSQAKILLLGKKPEENDPDYQKLVQLDKKCTMASSRLLEIGKDIEGLEQGFAPKELMQKSLPKLEKQLHLVSEELMQILESMDGMSLAENQKDARIKRRTLVDSIHALHKQCDGLVHKAQKLQGKD